MKFLKHYKAYELHLKKSTHRNIAWSVSGNGEIGPDKNSPLEPVSKCFDISYTSGSGKPLTPAQVAVSEAVTIFTGCPCYGLSSPGGGK